MTSLRSRTRVCRHTVVCVDVWLVVWVRVRFPARALFYPCFLGWGGVLLRSAARRACVLLSCRVGCVFLGGAPGGLAGVSGGCSAFLRGRRGITFTFFQYSAIMAVVTETNVNGREKRYAEYAYLHCAC